MKIGFYPGSFDPFTYGHLHVITQALKIFDKVIVGIATNPAKTRRFDKNIMKEAIEKFLKNNNIENVTVVMYDNFTGDVALDNNATFIIKGVRNGMDYQYEENIASATEKESGIDTVYIRAGRLGDISSSLAMELLRNNKDVSEYLPPEIIEVVTK